MDCGKPAPECRRSGARLLTRIAQKHRIAIAGFQHETNSFGYGTAGMPEFEMADSWPALLEGDAVRDGTLGLNLPISGFIEAAEASARIELHPVLWCAAEPSGPVTDHAFEAITARILDGLGDAAPLAGLYLDLHGAMITASHDDGEGELLRRIRAQLGPDLPIAVSLDMHANVTNDMVRHASSISIYRTYPHLDMGRTGARALSRLLRLLEGERPATAFRQLPYIIPMHAQHTGSDPMRRLYRLATEMSVGDVDVELAVGFTGGDIADSGPSLLASAVDQAKADAAADALLEETLAAETEFDCTLFTPEEAVEAALAYPSGRPVTIADVQDNPGGGTSSDTTGLLKALANARGKRVIVGVIHDPAAAAEAHVLGIGREFQFGLGGKSGISGDTPLVARFRVEALSNGEVAYRGEMYGGGTAEMGLTAVLRPLGTDTDIRIVTSSVRNQCLDRAYFSHVGLVPEKADIIAVKSTVHYRAEFEPISQGVISCDAPGALSCDIGLIPYRKLRPGIRLGPCGPVHVVPEK
ncbi:MAG: M81 family metallopeptidase [Boseongicola sp. SB0664_bin_43]|uniref:Microcystinase C n=1 Tax=Boseongicola sp. SB0664_bin_43 TaxID=2604844 RepID=A0A6B0Y5Z0_9RHOB|nr:M81 family metallopeptidase [Boseongicola sp. SB0664_bin_43]MYK31361.1 M81 family metallopeptidase [Boseongicola sp. SB0670_bin_30]